MNELSVLHISDFHCSTSSTSSSGYSWDKDLARKYAKYLREELVKQGNAPNEGRADLILATGDFVHKGDDSSFNKANTFLEQFAEEFAGGSRRPDVILCPGNHDYDRDYEDLGQIASSRAAYNNFSSKWHKKIFNKQRRSNIDRVEQFNNILDSLGKGFGGAQFVSPWDRFDGLPILSLDSTWSEISTKEQAIELGKKLHVPRKWFFDDSKLTVLFNNIASFLGNLNPTWPSIILTHYPVVCPSDIIDKRKKEGFVVEDHVSPYLKELIKVIEEATKMPVYVFSGDVHEAFAIDIFSAERDSGKTNRRRNTPSKQFVSGRSYQVFGSSAEVPWMAGARFTRILKEDDAKVKVLTLVMKFGNDVDREFDPSKNHWSLHSDSIPFKRTRKKARNSTPKIEVEGKTSDVSIDEKGRVLLDEAACDLSEFIKENKLVDLRRIKCSADGEFSRLLQIKIGPIMNDRNQKDLIIKSLCQGFTQFNLDKDRVLLVGIDCWGFSVATQLGFQLGLKSVGISVRGLNDGEIENELKRRFTQRKISQPGPRAYCYVTDVIATGDTLNRVKAKMPNSVDVSHFGLAMIRSAYSHSNSELNSMVVFSVIDRFNVPVLPNSDLPDEGMLPSKSFGLH
jgi:predicted MPP superfamily phosphohydrolase